MSEKKIRILGYRYGDNDSASTRIRFNRVLEAMKNIDLEISEGALPDIEDETDVYYIQKRADSTTYCLACHAQERGVPVVYDIDDAPGQCASTDMENRMFNLAKIVTVDTEEKRLAFHNVPDEKIEVVPDCLDYFDVIPDKHISDGIKRVITFGREHSIVAAHPLIARLKEECPTLNVYYISDAYVPLMNGIATWVCWNIDVVKRYLINSDLAVLAQTEDARGNMRSNNRLTACMAAGLPAVVNGADNYKKTMNHAGYSDLVVSPNTIASTVKIMDSVAVRESLSANFQKYAWAFNSPEYIAEKLRKVFKRAINGTQPNVNN